MPTVIDSLLVKLGLDFSGFDSGKNKVKNSLKETQQEAKNTQKSFNEVAVAATKFLAVIGGAAAVKHFVMDMIETNSALDRLSRNLQISVQEISAWSNATEIAGGSADGLQGTMRRLSAEQTKLMLTGESGLIPYFYALGISMSDAYGKARPVNDLLLDIGQALLERAPDRATAFNMGQAMGIDEGTLNLILRGRKEAELMLSRQREFGAVSKQQAEEASRMRRSLIEGKQAFTAFGRELLSAATPALEKFFSLFSGLAIWMRDNQGFVKAFLTILTVGLIAISAALTPINLTAIAVASLAAAIALLYDDYQTWKKGGDSLIDWSKWEVGIKAAGNGIKWLRDLIGDMIYRAIAAVDVLGSLFMRDWKGAKRAAMEFWRGNGKTYGEEIAPTAAPSPNMALPRGIRNRNPGNLNFAGQAGATKESGPGGRFAVFGTMQEGVAALVRQIMLYVNRGRNTIRKILEVYAPAFENNTGAYINAVSRALGISPDTPLDVNNAQQVMGLVKAIAEHESGKGYLSAADISGGYSLATAGASKFAAGAGSPRAMGNQSATTVEGSKSVETHIGEVKVYTQATDAKGIANDMGNALDYLFTTQANYGLT